MAKEWKIVIIRLSRISKNVSDKVHFNPIIRNYSEITRFRVKKLIEFARYPKMINELCGSCNLLCYSRGRIYILQP